MSKAKQEITFKTKTMTNHRFKTTNIKGKEYVQVNERIHYFRTATEYQGWSLETEMVEITEQGCLMRATAKNQDGRIIATGYASEDRSSSMINKTSYVENCETSAWGRCLANLGIGIGPEMGIASAEEVQMAIAKQEQDSKPGALAGSKKIETRNQAVVDFEARLGLVPTIDQVLEQERTKEKYSELLAEYANKGGTKPWPSSQGLSLERMTKGIQVLTEEIAKL